MHFWSCTMIAVEFESRMRCSDLMWRVSNNSVASILVSKESGGDTKVALVMWLSARSAVKTICGGFSVGEI